MIYPMQKFSALDFEYLNNRVSHTCLLAGERRLEVDCRVWSRSYFTEIFCQWLPHRESHVEYTESIMQKIPILWLPSWLVYPLFPKDPFSMRAISITVFIAVSEIHILYWEAAEHLCSSVPTGNRYSVQSHKAKIQSLSSAWRLLSSL